MLKARLSEKVCRQIRITVHFFNPLNYRLHFHETMNPENILDNFSNLAFLDSDTIGFKENSVSAPSHGGLCGAAQMADFSRNLPYISLAIHYILSHYLCFLQATCKVVVNDVFVACFYFSLNFILFLNFSGCYR